MQTKILGCPTCEEPTSFSLNIEGTQENATFVETDDGSVMMADAGSVHVDWFDPKALYCSGCQRPYTKDELVVVEDA